MDMDLDLKQLTDFSRAKNALASGEYTCVLCRGDSLLTATARGVSPMLDWLDEGLDLRGYCGADKVVGKAAALLFVLGGIVAVYADVMSRSAISVLERHGIFYEYGIITDAIINRAGTGPCPMERTVEAIDDPAQAREAVVETRRRLRMGISSPAATD